MSKPKIRKHMDEYAIESGEHYVCSLGGICARGITPEAAFSNLNDHLDQFSKHRQTPSKTRMFA